MKLSIVIPVYNVENYLESCIESILSKNIKSYEIILVDDGSTDRSGNICDNYSKKYKFIKTLHKKNGGLSSARNAGINASIGDYLMFIDSDDFLFEECDVNGMLNVLKEDILQYKMIYYYDKEKKYKKLKDIDDDFTGDYADILLKKVKDASFSISACDKIVKRSIVVDNNIFFDEKLLSEDIDWSLKLYLNANSIKTINKDVYVYRQQRIGSITNNVKSKNIESIIFILKKWKNIEIENEIIKKAYLNYLAYWYVILLTESNKNNCTKEQKLELMSMKELLNYNENFKVNLSKKVINIFGFKLGFLILKFYLYMKNKGLIKI